MGKRASHHRRRSCWPWFCRGKVFDARDTPLHSSSMNSTTLLAGVPLPEQLKFVAAAEFDGPSNTHFTGARKHGVHDSLRVDDPHETKASLASRLDVEPSLQTI